MVNAVGNLPIFAQLTSLMTPAERAQTYRTAILTAASVVLSFAFFGAWMLDQAFQVEIEAFKIAGGILIFIVAARGMAVGHPNLAPASKSHSENVGVFPLGFPFLAGPGTIVTTILLMQSEGSWLTALAAVLVYAAILPLLFLATHLQLAVGRVGVMVVSRILYIFVAAKAVAFVLGGLQTYACKFLAD